jgi:hypothetical protein
LLARIERTPPGGTATLGGFTRIGLLMRARFG